MQFGVLGTLELWDKDGETVRVPETRVRALLVALLLAEGRPVPAERLIDELWGSGLPADPARVLRAKVSQLRGVLERAEEGARSRVVHSQAGYRLEICPDEVDAARFRSLLARARRTDDLCDRVATLDEALALWRGPALADHVDEPFAAHAAARLEEERLTAREEHAEIRFEMAEHHSLADELAELTARHPLRERLHATHMKALYRAGRQAEALECYERLRHRLAEELGVDPGPELAALHQEILRQDPQLAPHPATRPSDPPAPAPGSNLPAPVDELIDRARETEEVRELLRTARLVTLTGPGGVGKTRLAVETATGLAADHRDGVWLVELGSLPARSEPGAARSVADAVESVLGIHNDVTADSTATPTATRLASALRGTQCLLVLDNCEHLLGAAADLVQRLSRSAPGVRWMATSREPLGLPGEHVYDVPLLSLPPLECPRGECPPEQCPPGEATHGQFQAASAEDSGAVQLFAARASASAPSFRLDATTLPLVVSICRRLDGLPLALELAAHRVRALGLREVAARLDDRFALLATGGRRLPTRQQTLRAVIDWSWGMLSEEEKAVLRRLVAHSDGCTLRAAEAVNEGVDPDGSGVLEPLTRLVERSLVTAVEGPHEVRYRMLESVSVYAAERLRESGEDEETRLCHMRHYVALAEEADPLLRGREQRYWLHRLSDERANMSAALDTALRHGDADASLRLAVATFWHRWIKGRHGEAHRALTRALALAGGSRALRARANAWRTFLDLIAREPANPLAAAQAALDLFDGADDEEGRSTAKWALSPALVECGEIEAAEALGGQALSAFRARGNDWGIAASLANRAWLDMLRGALPRFETDGAHALELFTEIGDEWGTLEAMAALWRQADTAGDYEEAERIGQEALRLAQDLSLWRQVSFWLACLGGSALNWGDLPRAESYLERARKLAAEHGERYGERVAGFGLGMIARRAGELGRAERHFRAWLGDGPWDQGSVDTALALSEMGFLAEQRGEHLEALRLQRKGLTAARATCSPRALALALTGLAGAHTLAGDPREAARLLGAADAARASSGTPLPPTERPDLERVTAATRAALEEGVFTAEFTLGRSR